MKYRIFVILLLCFLYSCKEKKTQSIVNENNINIKPADINDFNYKLDSLSDDVAVLVIGSNGEMEYVVNKPENIFQKTKNGLEYRFISKGNGNIYPKPGDVVTVVMTYKTEKDSIIFDTRNISDNFIMELKTASHKGGCIEEAFGMLSKGDSAIFKINASDFYTYTQKKDIPKFIKKGDKLIFNVKMINISAKNDFVKKNSDVYKYYLEQEKVDIEKLILDLNYPCNKLSSGLNIISIDKGAGKKVKKGNTVTIDYTASFIDGSVFGSTIENNEPFSFVVGEKKVIEGLEEAVQEMRIGDHAILIIPFNLAYQDKKVGMIPPFSTLIFEVKILDAK